MSTQKYRVLVTGGAGYIGSALVSKLLEHSEVEQIIVYDSLVTERYNILFDTNFHSSKLEFVQGDILDTQKLEECIKKVNVIYHLAARVAMPLSNFGAHQFEQVNIWGTAELSYLVEKYSNIERVIYLSSSSVYGYNEVAKSEKDYVNPISFYAISKYRAEAYLERLQKDKEILIIRSGNTFGYSSSMRLDSIINRLVYDVLFFNRVKIEGDGSQKYSFISINGICDILLASLELNNKSVDTIQNAIVWNFSLLDILDALQAIVPGFERMYVSKNIRHQNVIGQINEKANTLITKNHKDFQVELSAFLDAFVVKKNSNF